MKTRLMTLFVLVVSLALVSTPNALARGMGTAVSTTTVPQQGHNVQLVGSYELLKWPHGVAVVGDTAYVTDVDGLHILDVSDPAAPAEISLFDIEHSLGVAVAGDYAYVAAGVLGSASLHVADISDPIAPVETGLYNTPEGGISVAVAGGPAGLYAYIADGGAGLRVVDVSDPTDPAEVGIYDTPALANDVVVASGPGGTFAYVADLDFSGKNNGVRIIDVSNPAAPTQVGSYNPGFGCWTCSVAVVDNYAYVANYGCGLRAVDISNPAAPAQVSVWYGADPVSVAVAGKYAYAGGSENNGLRVLNISNPATPTEFGSYSPLGNAFDIEAVDRPEGSLVFVVDNWVDKLLIVRFRPFELYMPIVARN